MDNRDSMDKLGAFGVGLAAGALVGLALGVLYAPHKGSVTRDLIKEKTEDVKEQAEEIIEKAKKKAEDIVAKAREKVVELKKKEA